MGRERLDPWVRALPWRLYRRLRWTAGPRTMLLMSSGVLHNEWVCAHAGDAHIDERFYAMDNERGNPCR